MISIPGSSRSTSDSFEFAAMPNRATSQYSHELGKYYATPLLIYSQAPFFMMFRDFLRKTLHYALFIITRKILLPFEDQRFFLNGTC
ncbi:MAG: hypothetical protein ACP5I2_07605 [Fervidicoccaceae archaeon]